MTMGPKGVVRRVFFHYRSSLSHEMAQKQGWEAEGVGAYPLARQRLQLVPHSLTLAQEVAGQKQNSSILQVRRWEPQG